MSVRIVCRTAAVALILSATAIGLSAAPAVAAASAEKAQPAETLVKQSGVKGGLVVCLGDAAPDRLAAMRVSNRYVVQGLESDARRLAKTRAALRARGLAGCVTVIRWPRERPQNAPPARLPYADNLVNLLVADDLAGVARDEVLRVLAPRGVAMIKARGEWTKTVKPWPKAIDEWTHFLHAPDNNAVAADTQVEPPRHLQWVGGPKWARSHDHLASISAVVSAAGRIFYVADEGPVASVKAPSKWMLVARDAFSGVLLWKRRMGKWEDQLRPFRSGPAEMPRRLVAVGDRVYVTLGYGQPVTALDAATGRTLRTYEGTANTHEIVCRGGKLYLVISEPLKEASPTTGRVLRKFNVWRGAYLEYVVQYMPKHLRVLDAETGKPAWQKDDGETANLLPLTLAVAGGRVYFQNYRHLVALKADSGEAAWRADRPAVRHRYAWLTPTLVVADGVVLSADRAADKPVDTGGEDRERPEWRVSANHILTGGQIMAFSAETGKLLWTAPCHEGFNSPADVFVIGGKVYSGVLAWGRQPGITKVYDLKTGEVVAERPPDQKTYTLGFGHHRCYRDKATTRYIIQGRAGVEFLPVGRGRVDVAHWVRGGCQYGIVPCNGLVYAPSHSCACYITAKLSGFNAVSGARAKAGEPKAPERLEKGQAYAQSGKRKAESGAAPALAEARRADDTNARNPQSEIRNPQSKDWPTYRHDAARSGATDAALAPKLAPKWDRALVGPLTPVVVADGRLFLAQRDAHTVHALRADDGRSLWQYTAGGRVDSPPTVHAGRAYFGSADGWIYCLRAADGALVWRFRAAPGSEQITSYGQLESVWPVHGTVLVCAGVGGRVAAYAAAGRSSYVDGGVYLVGVDAATGERLFRRRLCDRDPKTGLEPQKAIRGVQMPGAMTDVLSTDGTSLFMRHLRFDLAGEPLKANVDHLFSSVGFLDDTWWHRTYWQIGTNMRGGYGGWPVVGNARISGRLLVQKGDCVYGFGRKGYTVTGSHLGLQSEFHLFAADAELIAPAKAKKAQRRRAATKVSYRWSKALPFHPRAMALAGETLFVAGPSEVTDFHAARPAKPVHLWSVSAADGSKIAARALKAAPVLDSFAVCGGCLYFTTADGRVVCCAGGK